MAYKKNSGLMSSPYGNSEGSIAKSETELTDLPKEQTYDEELSEMGKMMNDSLDSLEHFNKDAMRNPSKTEVEKEVDLKPKETEPIEVVINFAPGFKNIMIQILLTNKMEIKEVNDSRIIFKHNKKSYIVLAI